MSALPEELGECAIPVGGRDAVNLQVSGRVGERAVLHVSKKSKVGQEISTKYGLFDIGNDEHPPESEAQAKGEGKGTDHKGRNCRAIDST